MCCEEAPPLYCIAPVENELAPIIVPVALGAYETYKEYVTIIVHSVSEKSLKCKIGLIAVPSNIKTDSPVATTSVHTH